jgi:hypothetical protein
MEERRGRCERREAGREGRGRSMAGVRRVSWRAAMMNIICWPE